MAHHRLFEWESRRFDADGSIPVGEAERLVRASQAPAKRLKGAQRAFDFGREALGARNLVGMVAASGTSCEILPKVDRDAAVDEGCLRRQLVRMLGVAYDLPIADDAATTLDTQNETLLEVLITKFVKLLEEAVRRGLPRSYVYHADDLPALRGRLDIQRQFTSLAMSPQLLACRYDEFSADIPLNQVMKAVLTRLAQLARSVANQRAIVEMLLVYADVSTVPQAALRWDAILPDRGSRHWSALTRLARLLLGDHFQNSAYGASDGFALLFDMNALFERYLERLLGQVAPAFGWRMTAQGGSRACLHGEGDGEALFSTYPDIQLHRDGRVEMVLDAKWKRLTAPSAERAMGVLQADVYQLMAYSQVYACRRLFLLYPQHDGLDGAVTMHHRIADPRGTVRFTIATVDVSSHANARRSLEALLAGADGSSPND